VEPLALRKGKRDGSDINLEPSDQRGDGGFSPSLGGESNSPPPEKRKENTGRGFLLPPRGERGEKNIPLLLP